jgi:hypothetical protein
LREKELAFEEPEPTPLKKKKDERFFPFLPFKKLIEAKEKKKQKTPIKKELEKVKEPDEIKEIKQEELGKKRDKFPGKSLYNDQIDRYMEPFIKYGYIGCIEANEIELLIPKIKSKDIFGFIMNILPKLAPEKEIGH